MNLQDDPQQKKLLSPQLQSLKEFQKEITLLVCTINERLFLTIKNDGN